MGLKLIDISHKIKNIINKHGAKYITRERKSNEIDALLFYFLHSRINISMDTATADLNHLNSRYFKKAHISRQSISSRAESLPETFYESVCFDISNLIDKAYFASNKYKYSYDILAVDGSDTNLRTANAKSGYKLNKSKNSITALNLGIYNVTRNYPVDISLVKHSDERKAFLDIVNGKLKQKDFSNSIFVYDRGFDGYTFFEKLEKLGLKYVCRLRSNSSLIDPNLNDSIKQYGDDNDKTIRIIKYSIKKTNYYLATNLYDRDEFNISKLKQIYHKRWSIEEAFKYIKRNFHFGISELKSDVSIRKSICCQIIIMKLANLMASIGRNKLCRNNKANNRNPIKDNRIINRSTITHGLYNHLLFVLFNGFLTRKTLNNFFINYVVLITTNRGKNVPHVCVTPSFKWYVKQHVNKEKYEKELNKKVT